MQLDEILNKHSGEAQKIANWEKECSARDKNIFPTEKEIFIFQSLTFLAVIQSWPVRPLVGYLNPSLRISEESDPGPARP